MRKQPAKLKGKKEKSLRVSRFIMTHFICGSLRAESQQSSHIRGKAATANRFNLSLLCDNKAKGEKKKAVRLAVSLCAGMLDWQLNATLHCVFSCTCLVITTSAGDTIGSIFNGALKPGGIEGRTEV